MLKIEANNGFASVLDSDWTLIVKAVKVAESDGIHAWLERSAANMGFVNGSDDMTLTIPGTSRLCDYRRRHGRESACHRR